jgi:chemotaxis protein histidine kinase CheA/ActR/RegA family two-component response regulator
MTSQHDVNSDPLCLLEDAFAGLPHDADRMASARGYLRDIVDAAQESERSGLSRLATTLEGLLELVEAQAGDEGRTGELVDFLRGSLDPLRAAIFEEPDADDRVNAALDFAQAQWGEYLSLMGDSAPADVADAASAGSEAGSFRHDDVWGDAPETADSDPWEGNDLPKKQTREEIERILGSIAGTATAADGLEVLGAAPNDPVPEAVAEIDGDGTAPDAAGAADGPSEQQVFGKTDFHVPNEPPAPVALDMGPELLEAYLDDASAGVGRLEQLVLAVERDPHDESLHRQICRELHTLKGASASVGLPDLAAYLHAVEDYIDASKGTAIDISPMLNSVDAVRRQIATLAGRNAAGAPRHSGEPGNSAESSPVSPAFDSVGSGQEESLRVKASRVDRLMDLLAELVILRNQRDSRLSRLKQLHSELTRCVTRLRVLSDGIGFGVAGRVAGISESQFFSGVITEENLNLSTCATSQSGSVIEIASDVAEFARTLRDLAEPMEAENVTISQFTRQFRMELIEMRRMPVSGLFQRLNRAARDAARTEGRRIEFRLQGEHAGLDRSLQERLYEPLLHIVRNAVSHGIESPEDRRKAGKPETGTITLSAKGSPTTLVIEVSDDGRGLDYEAIRRKALDKGLIAVGEATEEARLARLIFHPGFSTRQETNAISGRGVGMDVVSAALHRMRAKIDVESRAGKGTTMRLTIPLRSVIEHAMVVRVSGRLYALPMQFVQAARPLQPGADSGWAGSSSANEAGLTARDGIRLRTLLGDDKSPPPEREHIVLLGSGRLSFSDAATERNPLDPKKSSGQGADRASGMVLIVDDVVGPEEVVVRSLPSLLKSHPLLGGVTLSGAGEIVQLLDGQRLLDFAAERAANPDGATGAAKDPSRPRRPRPPGGSEKRRVLVVDDSLSARRRLVQLLKQMGFEVTEAGDGLEGIDRMRSGHFRFVFTDLEMPRLDGFGFLSEIKRTYTTPVAIVTSRGEAECRDQAKELGADGYLFKPATEPALAELIAELEAKVEKSEDLKD